MTDLATVAHLINRHQALCRIELTEQRKAAIKARTMDALGIVNAVATCQRISADNNAAIQRVMPCRKPECTGKRCEANCNG